MYGQSIPIREYEARLHDHDWQYEVRKKDTLYYHRQKRERTRLRIMAYARKELRDLYLHHLKTR